jgi:glycosyltransferase involved in cell wall biosynthesis
MARLAGPLQAIRSAKKWKYIYYFPVDGDLAPEWVNNSVAVADYPVAYTKYGQQQVKKCAGLKVPYIYHGVDTKVFYPLTKKERDEFRASFLKAKPRDFVVTNVNRNTARKDIPRTIIAWRELKKKVRNAKLYLHMDMTDPVGYDLLTFVKHHMPPEIEDDIIYPDPGFMKRLGLPKQAMRSIYGASDVVISTSLGEGWGLSTTEAMAFKVPVVMPKHTSSTEIIGENGLRGHLADCDNFYVLRQHDNYQERPLVSVPDLNSRIRNVAANPAIAKKKVDAAYRWVKQNCDWDKIAEQWDAIFTKAYRQVRRARKK